jgi:hypothetical protein
MSTTLTKFFPVVSGTQVRLEIRIGEQQTGKIWVDLGEASLAAGVPTFDQTLGQADDLHARTADCTILVADTNPNTNDTSVTIRVTDGVSEFKNTMVQTAEADGAAVHYTASIKFYLA